MRITVYKVYAQTSFPAFLTGNDPLQLLEETIRQIQSSFNGILKVVIASVSLFCTLIHMTFMTSVSKCFNTDIKILGNHPCYSFDLPCLEI